MAAQASNNLDLPPLPSLHEAVLTLKQDLEKTTLNRDQRYAAYHELHRLLFLMYLLQANNIEKEARIDAHHAFSQLYHLPGSAQYKRRTLLSRFVAEIYTSGLSPSDDTRFITHVAKLEEALCPFVLEHPQGQAVLFAFSKSACAMSVRPRLTRTHKAIWISSIIVGIGIIVALSRLLNKMVQTEEELSAALLKVEHRHSELAQTARKKIQELGNQSFFKWLFFRHVRQRLQLDDKNRSKSDAL